MNRIYKTVWNEKTGTYVAVSENACGRGKRTGSSRGAEAAEGQWPPEKQSRVSVGTLMLAVAMMGVGVSAHADVFIQDSIASLNLDGSALIFSGSPGRIQFSNGGVVTGLNDGTLNASSTDAVTGRQLFSVQQTAQTASNGLTALNGTVGSLSDTVNKGWNLKAGAESGVGEAIKSGDTVTVAGGKNIDVSRNGSTITVATKDDLAAKTVVTTGAVTVGGPLTVNGASALKSGVTVSGASQLNGTLDVTGKTSLKGGLDLGGTKISNVAEGAVAAGSKEAITGGQLYTMQNDLYEVGAGIKYFHANSTGPDSQASGEDAVAIGPQSIAAAKDSLAAGSGATVAQQAEAGLALGKGAVVGEKGVGALALGRKALAEGASSIALGDAAQVASEFAANSVAIGSKATVSGQGSSGAVALGNEAIAGAGAATAIGNQASAAGGSAIALGNHAAAGSSNGIAIGSDAQTQTLNSIALGTGAGQGTVEGAINPGYDKTSHIAIGTHAGQRVTGNQSTALGYGAGSDVNGDYTVAIGNEAGTHLDGNQNISIGYQANQSSVSKAVGHAVAIGGESRADSNSVAVGDQALAQGAQSTVLGSNAQASGDWGVALGANSRAQSDSVALGTNSQAASSQGVGFLTGSNAAFNPVAVVSVGRSGGERRVVNVADGSAGTDAVNVNQLNAAQKNLADVLGDGTLVDGKVTEFEVGGKKYTSVASALTDLGNGGAGTVINDVGAVLYDGGSSQKTVSLGGVGGTTIKNLKAGSDDTDATNLGQVKSMVDAEKVRYYDVNSTLNANQENTGATGAEAIAMGPAAAASGASALAVGHEALSTGKSSVAVGNSVKASADNATAIGHGSIAYHDSTVAIGNAAQSRGENSIVIGTRAESDAKEGNATVNNAIVIGTDADVTADNGIAMGEHAVSSSTRGVAVGYQAAARGVDSQALGSKALATGVNAAASGTGAHAAGGDSIASGTDSRAYASNGIALGNSAVAGKASPKPGEEVKNTNTVAIGTRANAQATNSVALGSDSNTESGYGSTVARYSKVGHDDAQSGVVSVGNHGGQDRTGSIERRITNLAGGMADTDAVNVKQLRAVRDTPWSYAGNSGQTNQTMGSTVAIVGANTGSTTAQNVKTVVTGGTQRTNSDGDVVYEGGKIEIQFAETPQFKGADMGGKKITSVAAGTVSDASTDAVNGSQLKQVKDTAEKGWNLSTNSGVASNVAPGGKVDLANTDGNIKIAQAGGNVQFNLADDVKVKNDLTVGGNTSIAGNTTVAGMTNMNGGATISKSLTVNPNTNVNFGGNKITNVAAGAINNTSTDVVIGSQLNELANKPITFKGDVGQTDRKLGETQTIRGSLASGAAASSGNIRTEVKNGEMEILLANNLTADSLTINNGGPVINSAGVNMNGKKITHLAKGTDGTDAVNVDQLTDVSDVANKGWNLTANGTNSSNVAPGGVVDLANKDGNIVVAKTGNDVQFNLANDVGIKNNLSVGGGLSVNELASLNGGLLVSATFTVAPGTIVDFGNNKVAGVAAGAVNSTSTEAINGAQLYDVANRPITFAGNAGSVERKLGETQMIKGSLDVTKAASSSNIRTQVNKKGEMEILLANNLTADSLTINNGGPVISRGGINMGGKKITKLAEGTNGTDAVNLNQLNAVNETANKGWNLTANGAGSSKVAPGDTVDLANTDGNIDVTKVGNDVQFNLAKDIALDSVTTGETVLNTDGITINGGAAGPIVLNNTGLTAGTVVISSISGINAGGFQITNVKAGVADTDAVNVSQLKDVQTNVDNLGDRAVKYDGNVGDPKNKVTLEGDVSTDGGRTGGTQVTNVARGEISANSTDAVNGSQIHDMGNSIADGMGGNSTFVDGKLVTELNVGGNSYNNVNDALNGVQSDVDNVTNIANKGWNVQTNGDTASKVGPGDTVQFINGDNVEISRDGTNITVGMSKDIKVSTVTADKVTTKEVKIEDGPTINQNGIDMGDKQITNLSDGKADSDAVNLGQLNRVAGNTATQINRLDSRISGVDNRASAGVAAAMAAAGLPQAYLPGKSMFSLGGGTWRGESGYAMGLSTISDNGKWVVKGTASGSSRGDYGGSVGVGYQW